MVISFVIGPAQLLYLGLGVISVLASVLDHGKPQPPESAWRTLVSFILCTTIIWMGGFFRGGC